MPRNIEDMIIPEKRRSIRDIPIPESRRKLDRLSQNQPLQDINVPKQIFTPTPPPPRSEFNHISSPRRPRRGLWIALSLSALIIIVALLTFFGGGTLSYVPKSSQVFFEEELVEARKSGESSLLFSVVKFSSDKGVSVPTSGSAEVSRRASGTIIVYNNFSNDPQRLIENTRFESPDGKIYRIEEAISIPGRRTVSGTTQPGSIEARVLADEPGEEYNIGLTDFTVPGLANTPRYTSIYARSKTPMVDGFVGVERAVSEDDKTRARISLENGLREELLAEMDAQVPPDFVLFPTLSNITYEELPQSDSSSVDAVTMNLRGHFAGIIFKRADISTYLVRDELNLSPGEVVNIANLESLNVVSTTTLSSDFTLLEEIDLSVSGQALVVWRIDETLLKTDILGKSKSEVASILTSYPTIVRADLKISPFWKMKFPTNPKNVTIKKLPVQ